MEQFQFLFLPRRSGDEMKKGRDLIFLHFLFLLSISERGKNKQRKKKGKRTEEE